MYASTPQAGRERRRTEPPKMIAVDVDGTLVGYQEADVQRPSRETIAALKRVRDAGVPVAIVTGRPMWAAVSVAEDLEVDGGYISGSHGAVEYSIADRAISRREFIDARRAVEAFRGVEPAVEFAFERDLDGWYHTPGFARDFAADWAGAMDLDDLLAEPVARIVARVPSENGYHDGVRCPNALRLVREAGLSPDHYYVEPGYKGWVDVSPPGLTKATGLAGIAERYGVDAAEVAVFGDAHNDLPMFEWAGHAVAMGQADDTVKAAADEVTLPVSADGVAAVLNRWFH
ncbi:HAD family hydrolase [Salininema proteolyticum]|uniref:HAD family hydrolase n=1 Tax=Salininema proteolyticum TaxID=1607685 RepID=A0ABV8U315_9ACTN